MSLKEQLGKILDFEPGYIDILFNTGLLDEQRAKRYVVKHEYFERVKKAQGAVSCFSIKLDLVAEYNVSRSFVDKLLYHYVDLKV